MLRISYDHRSLFRGFGVLGKENFPVICLVWCAGTRASTVETSSPMVSQFEYFLSGAPSQSRSVIDI